MVLSIYFIVQVYLLPEHCVQTLFPVYINPYTFNIGTWLLRRKGVNIHIYIRYKNMKGIPNSQLAHRIVLYVYMSTNTL